MGTRALNVRRALEDGGSHSTEDLKAVGAGGLRDYKTETQTCKEGL